ncbi:hypothetical protein LNP04_16020 [Chryseobacterium sp. C-71]|uniref:hypothetical protein n=1 Tax=Chryseobacterium sp. C-71 TaxID=2893882 RepID=UPI001E4B3514|nr:hypothetical protein [Chryseobacterium sp. C-71]UFH31461.1 hypothetical protein LNP04_16020 [Chryseobacterium sp. C-71]
MDFFSQEFASENNLLLDYSLKSLDDLENWIITNYPNINALKEDQKILDLLTIYIGETFRKHLGGKWFIDLEDKDNAYYHMPVLTSPYYKGEIYKAPRTFATACIPRKKGNYISTILKNNMEDMSIPIEE